MGGHLLWEHLEHIAEQGSRVTAASRLDDAKAPGTR